ncbi:hypothetical protein BgiBS90_012386 [Biomphalaria glabrata]|nr:hypothetical protein BgiBS90_012386 [Biomphalaria glabrata]
MPSWVTETDGLPHHLPTSPSSPHFPIISPLPHHLPTSPSSPHFTIISPLHIHLPTSHSSPHYIARLKGELLLCRYYIDKYFQSFTLKDKTMSVVIRTQSHCFV